MVSTPLLCRHAEAFFWMARYVERAENIARMLDVTQTFGHDSSGALSWMPIVQINADESRFREAYPEGGAQAVKRFYLTDPGNPTSVISAIKAARENARSLRALISTELWSHINVFQGELAALRSADIAGANLSHVCAMIRSNCQTHMGIADGTLFRGPGWYVYQVGRHLERADQTTRLLDIKYHLLLPSLREVGSQIDVNQWHSLLRTAGAYHAFRRVYPRGIAPTAVAAFLLFETAFPRAVLPCVQHLEERLGHLARDFGVPTDARVEASLHRLHRMLETTIETVVAEGLHEFLDGLQRQFVTLTAALTAAYFQPDMAEAA